MHAMYFDLLQVVMPRNVLSMAGWNDGDRGAGGAGVYLGGQAPMEGEGIQPVG